MYNFCPLSSGTEFVKTKQGFSPVPRRLAEVERTNVNNTGESLSVTCLEYLFSELLNTYPSLGTLRTKKHITVRIITISKFTQQRNVKCHDLNVVLRRHYPGGTEENHKIFTIWNRCSVRDLKGTLLGKSAVLPTTTIIYGILKSPNWFVGQVGILF
jgi:hypothetical protein